MVFSCFRAWGGGSRRSVTEAVVDMAEVGIVNSPRQGAALATLAGQVQLSTDVTKAARAVIHGLADLFVGNTFAKTHVHLY